MVEIDHDLKIHFDKFNTKMFNFDGVVFGKATQSNNLHKLTAHVIAARIITSKLWHKRFGHHSLMILKRMDKSMMVAKLLDLIDLVDVCKACTMYMKAKRSNGKMIRFLAEFLSFLRPLSSYHSCSQASVLATSLTWNFQQHS